MKRLAILSAMFLLLSVVSVRAEKPSGPVTSLGEIRASGEVTPTPEMWFYDQSMRQYNSPQMAVRAKADIRAQQRLRRLESMKWYGFSNSRPPRQQRSLQQRLLARLGRHTRLLSVPVEWREPALSRWSG